MSPVEDAVAAIEAGELVVLPTDTVYGLACTPESEEAVRALSALKGRPPGQPLALLASSVDRLLELIPELRGANEAVARGLLPGPYTLVFPNVARRYEWLTAGRETIGVRVPGLEGPGREVLERVGAVAATSANRHGEPDPRALDDIPAEIRAGVAALLDSGELPGVPSTVLDLTGEEPRVLREGAVPAIEALAAVAVILGE